MPHMGQQKPLTGFATLFSTLPMDTQCFANTISHSMEKRLAKCMFSHKRSHTCHPEYPAKVLNWLLYLLDQGKIAPNPL